MCNKPRKITFYQIIVKSGFGLIAKSPKNFNNKFSENNIQYDNGSNNNGAIYQDIQKNSPFHSHTLIYKIVLK